MRLLANDKGQEPSLVINGATRAEQTRIALAGSKVRRTGIVGIALVAVLRIRVGEIGERERENVFANLGGETIEQGAIILWMRRYGENACVDGLFHFGYTTGGRKRRKMSIEEFEENQTRHQEKKDDSLFC